MDELVSIQATIAGRCGFDPHWLIFSIVRIVVLIAFIVAASIAERLASLLPTMRPRVRIPGEAIFLNRFQSL